MTPLAPGAYPTMAGRTGPVVLPGLAGIFIGGCVQRGPGSSFRRRAHAHNRRGDAFFGWVCIRSARRLLAPSGKPSTLLLHEYAHILTPNHGHDEAWRAAITALGRPAEAKRYRRPRNPLTTRAT